MLIDVATLPKEDKGKWAVFLDGKVQGMVYRADDEEGWIETFDPKSYLQEVKVVGSKVADPKKHIKKVAGKVEFKEINAVPGLAVQVQLAVMQKLKEIQNGTSD